MGRLSQLTFEPAPKRDPEIGFVAEYFEDGEQREERRRYFFYFAACQFLYLVNVIAQICFTQAFLDNEFLNLLPDFVQGSMTWNRIFPKLVKCRYLHYGSAGSPQTFDVLCVLAMNVLFEKLYLCVWILLSIALVTAIVQNILVFQMLIEQDDDEPRESGCRGLSDRLMLKFIKKSLDASVYSAFLDMDGSAQRV